MTKKMLTEQEVVHYSHVPYCLRHAWESDVLEDASCLLTFLQDSITRQIEDNDSPPDDWCLGMELCFKLLRDKIDIARGTRPFPLVTYEREENDAS